MTCQMICQTARDDSGLEQPAAVLQFRPQRTFAETAASMRRAFDELRAAEDALEVEALSAIRGCGEPTCALGSVASVVGSCGAAGSLLSVVRAALCLREELLPARREPADQQLDEPHGVGCQDAIQAGHVGPANLE